MFANGASSYDLISVLRSLSPAQVVQMAEFCEADGFEPLAEIGAALRRYAAGEAA